MIMSPFWRYAYSKFSDRLKPTTIRAQFDCLLFVIFMKFW